MLISLRLKNGWSPRVKNVGINGKYNCDCCGAKLFIGPGKVKYCDQVHSFEAVENMLRMKPVDTMASVRKAQSKEEFVFEA